MKPEDWLIKIQELDQMIRKGRASEARASIAKLHLKTIPREYVVDFANLARRVQSFKVAMRLLNPIIRSEKPLEVEPTPSELLEYGVVLQKLGAIDEAREIICEVDPHLHPQTFLYLATCFIAEWNYEQAIPLLKEYTLHAQVPAYQRLVGKVNLVAALIYEDYTEEAAHLLQEVQMEAQREGHQLLLGNTYELSAHLHLLKKDWTSCQQSLNEAGHLLKHSQSLSQLYVEKWTAVLASLQDGRPDPSLARVRNQALNVHHWETVRECDYYSSILSKNADVLNYVFFGTPFESYRRKLIRNTKFEGSPSENFLYTGDQRLYPSKIFDLSIANSSDGSIDLHSGQTLHRLMILLCRDFYKPLNLVTAYSLLYPGENFDPTHSPNRIYVHINRLRTWFAENEIPLEIGEIDGAYQLRFRESFGILIPREPLSLDARELEILKLRRICKDELFSSTELRKKLGVSFGTINSLLSWGVASGKFVKIGGGPKTKYKLAG